MSLSSLRAQTTLVLLLIAVASAWMALGAEPTSVNVSTPRGHTPGRLSVSIDGAVWKIAPDSENVGRDRSWWKNALEGAQPARVPGIIQESLPGYHGVAWYQCDFMVSANPYPGGRLLVHFGAVNYTADVWLNEILVGSHEGGETPFALDATDAVKPGASNRLTVRVVNPTGDRLIDGMVISETPHQFKNPILTTGCAYNWGGINEPVRVEWVSSARIEDVFVRPDWKTGKIRIQATVRNTAESETDAVLEFIVTRAPENAASASARLERRIGPGNTVIEAEVQVEQPRLWDVQEPSLYRLQTKLECAAASSSDEHDVRFGFRDFRVEKGFFRLNGRRIFLRSSHTLNQCPVGQVVPPAQTADLLRKDLLYMKASGFNAVRFIACTAQPEQLDLCDEIGLMVYEENAAASALADSPKMAERFDRSVGETIKRDRNHPSVVIWGLLNEVQDGPVFRHAVDSLKLVRSLDDTRLTLLGSGRWDGQYNIGSASNPGSAEWEHVWGNEAPDYVPVKAPKVMGDTHIYPAVPTSPDADANLRALGRDTKPIFLSEYGIGSLDNVIRSVRTYEQYGVNPKLDDMQYYRRMAETFEADWNRLGFNGVYAFPEDLLRESQRLHCRQRTHGFDLIRSNPNICGLNLTGLLDHVFAGEGLWTLWREWKPGIVEALQDGWAPLRWCLFASPMHGYVGRPVKLEAVLANDGVLAPGEYPVTLRVNGAAGTVWEQKTVVRIPQPASGEDGPLAVPVFTGEAVLSGPEGQYEFAANLDSGGAPSGGRLTFRLSTVPVTPLKQTVLTWGIDDPTGVWLGAHGVTCGPFETSKADTRGVILVGGLPGPPPDAKLRVELLRRVACGSVAVFLSPQAFKRGEDAVGWLPLKNKGKGYEFNDWLYHKECVAKAHPIFNGLQAKGIMDWDYYGPVIPHFIFEGQDTPDEVVAAAFAPCHTSPAGGYASGVLLGSYRFGEGWFVLNSLNLLNNMDRHPAADRLLLNLIGYAAEKAEGAAVPAPADFNNRLKEIAYE
ncbi:MAG: hypothetical protein HZB26_12925 [Candidatus Hydrogenedentes bacterium]|nr:hypothetical protein [Candidatus Hydrogenedentota bacterium]